MPGFRSHYVFGIETRNELKEKDNPVSQNIWQMIRDYPASYALGLQGPDIFFYNPSSYLHRRNTGERMHHERTLSFIEHLISVCMTVKSDDLRAQAFAYAAGFIGHYSLDTVCHPYIHYRACKDVNDNSNAGFYNHMLLECDIDCALLAHFLKLRPSEFHPSATIRLSHDESFIISSCLQRAIALTYPGSLVLSPEILSAFSFTRIVYDLMEDKNRWKKKLLRSVEDLFLDHPQFSAMIANDGHTSYPDPCNLRHLLWRNPWNTDLFSTESFYDLFFRAKHQYIRRLSWLLLIRDSEPGSRDYFDYISLLEKDLGNLSYDSGLPLK